MENGSCHTLRGCILVPSTGLCFFFFFPESRLNEPVLGGYPICGPLLLMLNLLGSMVSDLKGVGLERLGFGGLAGELGYVP